jgi:S1-C subfamily serine protease
MASALPLAPAAAKISRAALEAQVEANKADALALCVFYEAGKDCAPGAKDREAKGERPIILGAKTLENRPPNRIDLPDLYSLAAAANSEAQCFRYDRSIDCAGGAGERAEIYGQEAAAAEAAAQAKQARAEAALAAYLASREGKAPPKNRTRPIAFTRVASRLGAGQTIGRVRSGLFCGAVTDLLYNGRSDDLLMGSLPRRFHAQLSNAGYSPVGDPDNLFADKVEAAKAELQVGASLEYAFVDLCEAYGAQSSAADGRLVLGFEWQIYSSSDRRIVAQVHTRGDAKLDRPSTDAISDLSDMAIALNISQLLASDEFLRAFSTSSAPPEQTVATKGAGLAPLTYSNKNTGPTTVADGIGGVVAIFADNSLGSGFLIGAEGLLLTNRHVVGGAKYVKVRWADGVETVGEVLRSDAKRDVALVKTDPRGRLPLRLHPVAPQPGEDVYAIGTPLDEAFQSTVTKAVVSANRTVEGLSYIQSDVAVNHGNSGGPLLDKTGAVLGLTVISLQPIDNIPIGINLFIPLRDALDFLSLKPQG